MKLSAFIVGDEPQVRNTLQELLLKFYPEIFVAGTAETSGNAFTAIQMHKIDILFLDINPDNHSEGFELLDKLYKYDFDVVFLSDQTEHAVKAFTYEAAHYLLKPVEYRMLMETICRIKRRRATSTVTDIRQLTHSLNYTVSAPPSKIALSDMYTTQFVSLDDVAYLESSGSYTFFHLQDKQRYTKSKNLRYYEDALLSYMQFVRVHKSFIVNRKYVKAYRKVSQDLELFNGTVIPMSIGYRALIEQWGDHFIQ